MIVCGISCLGWLAFLVGSVLGSPIFDIRDDRDSVYQGASITIMIAQLIRLLPLFKDGLRLVLYKLRRFSRVYITDLLLLLAMMMYLIGTIILK